MKKICRVDLIRRKAEKIVPNHKMKPTRCLLNKNSELIKKSEFLILWKSVRKNQINCALLNFLEIICPNLEDVLHTR